jgi:hypothetical protein
MYTERQHLGNDRSKKTPKQGKLPESTPSRETLAQVFQRGSLQDQLLDLHGHREGYVRVKVSTWGPDRHHQPHAQTEEAIVTIVIVRTRKLVLHPVVYRKRTFVSRFLGLWKRRGGRQSPD